MSMNTLVSVYIWQRHMPSMTLKTPFEILRCDNHCENRVLINVQCRIDKIQLLKNKKSNNGKYFDCFHYKRSEWLMINVITHEVTNMY